MEIDTNYRTIVKILLWQIIAIIITIVILMIVLNDLSQAILLGLIDHSICMFTHYFYERVWNNISWGKKENIENE